MNKHIATIIFVGVGVFVGVAVVISVINGIELHHMNKSCVDKKGTLVRVINDWQCLKVERIM